jgi:hypothetical protein
MAFMIGTDNRWELYLETDLCPPVHYLLLFCLLRFEQDSSLGVKETWGASSPPWGQRDRGGHGSRYRYLHN